MSKLAKFLILVVLSAVLISSFWIVSFAEGSNAVCVTDQNYNNKSGNISNDAAKLSKAVAVKQDNINATDNTLAKAMYEFGIAAKAYRDYLVENS